MRRSRSGPTWITIHDDELMENGLIIKTASNDREEENERTRKREGQEQVDLRESGRDRMREGGSTDGGKSGRSPFLFLLLFIVIFVAVITGRIFVGHPQSWTNLLAFVTLLILFPCCLSICCHRRACLL